MVFASFLTLLIFLTAQSVSRENGDFLAPLEGMDIHDKYPDEYLVIFHQNYTMEQHFENIAQDLSSLPEFRMYSFGYRTRMDQHTRDEKVRRDPRVRMVETNRPVYGIEPHNVTVFEPSAFWQNGTSRLSKREYLEETEPEAPYGLQMITTPSERLDIPIPDEGPYAHVQNAGLGVQVYVLDTGIRTSHELFEGRARNFGGLGADDKSPYVDDTMADVRGHGTHVAGIIGARQYGVAPNATLVNVKVLNNLRGVNREIGDVAQAIIDVTAEHNANKAKARNSKDPWMFRGSVINMSFRWVGDGFGILYQLIDANNAGISVFAAAGNDGDDYGDSYPCANVQTRCIAAVDSTYNKWKPSNYGSMVDFVAPGKDVLSLHSKSNIAIARMSGTSQAAPHAAGTAAIFTSWSGLETHYDLSQNFIYWNSIDGVVSGFPSGTTTYLINTGIHSPKKYPKEPFRWGKDHPSKPQTVDDPSSSVIDAAVQSAPPPLPDDSLMTTVYTEMGTATVQPVTSMSTLAGVLSDSDSDSTDIVTTTTTRVESSPTSTSGSIPIAGPSCASSGTPFSQPPAQNLIDTFCAQPMLNAQFVPYIAIGNMTSQFGQTKAFSAEGHFALDGTTNAIWFRTRFTHDACTGSFNGTFECAKRFATILNGCQTDTITAKLGGTLSNVCAEYELTVVDEHTNPFADDEEPAGDFTCRDTTSPVSETYPNTCTCWMSERVDQTAVFVKPGDGVCDSRNVDQVDGLAPGQGY
ncbi:hypothetical protein M409DRAFT_56957 [Zasmidium cellare ATCC 36951]|uniref:Peptidase S8/S53 domain-containing protein n=1 Tax=Zasmidium cellare ATCC 36951 TaxID=1080233 RepID=A0A6A6CD39_ZASCE|nr:uncharacterized protein M409DRAFT_56957 [Zasmidium cellare ATCC 36951]KAF2163842.1 hypothetical protein M409DRAFT_56957 [Zasmidium cellare ATCC 36951]